MSTRDSTRDDQSTIAMDHSPGTPSSTGSATTDGAPFAFHPSILQCFICREPPTDPISTSCGDVFCWPCMHQLLQDGPKPCPVCGYTLRRDLNIIPLYGGGASTNAGTSASINTTTEATSEIIDIPPRPRNPLLLTASPTPSSVLTTSYERSIHHLSESLEAERVRVMSLDIDRMDMELEVVDLQCRHTELRRAVHDRERILGKERDEVVRSGRRVKALEERNGRLAWQAEEERKREKRHIERSNQMAELIARLQQRLEVADRHLPQG